MDGADFPPLPGQATILPAMTPTAAVSPALAHPRAAPAWDAVYDAFVESLVRRGAGRQAPRAGDRMPDFALPDHDGRYRRLSDLMAGGPFVLSFQRGAWCPYCRGELDSWAAVLPGLRASGGGFAAVAAEVGGRAARWRAEAALDAPILCDTDHGLALALGLAFHLSPELDARYRAAGLDLAGIYGGTGGVLAIPAVFALGPDRTVRHAHVDPDFRRRADPDAIIAALR